MRTCGHARLLLSAALCSLCGVATAASFQILEQSPAHLGTAFAGTGSNINDASTVFFNPAAMGKLDSRAFTLGGNAIFTRAKFNDEGSTTGAINGKTDEIGYVPNIYYVQPLTERLTFGVGINAPYGIASKYRDDWVGRYLATHSELEVINVNATFALDISDTLSIGAGINYQQAEVTLQSKVDSTLGVAPSPATDSHARIKGDDDALAADLSVYFAPSERTRLGVVWRQGGKFHLEGDARFTPGSNCAPGQGYPTGAPPAPTTGTLCAGTLAAQGGAARADFRLPDTITVSATRQLTDYWWLHGDIAWTEWSSIQAVDIINTANNVQVSQLELLYDDTMRYALGFTHKSDCPWTWRFGIAFDEAPQTRPHINNPRIPDQDRLWLSAGFNYAFSEQMSLDLGYTYIKVDKTRIDNTNPQTGHHVAGHFDSNLNIVGMQANWKF